MRIALVTHTFFPESVGGREKYVFSLAKVLAKLGYTVCVFTCSDKLTKEKKIQQNGFKTVYLKTFKISVPGAKYRIPFGFSKKLKEFNPDIIHTNDSRHFTTFLSYIFSKKYKKPMILTEHGFHSLKSFTKIIYTFYNRLISQKIFRQSKKIITVSKSFKKEVISLGIPVNKIEMIYNSLNLEEYDIKIRRDKKNSKNKIIFSAGRLIEEKGFQYLIKAIPILLEEFPNLILMLAGPNHYYKKHLENISNQLNIRKQVLFLGEISEYKLKKFMKLSDIIVIPSLYEPFGIIALEAMAMGKPIVASKIGGLSEIISEGKTGLFVNPGSHLDIYEKVRTLLNNEKLSKKLSKQAKNESKKYDWEKNIGKIIRIYKSVIK